MFAFFAIGLVLFIDNFYYSLPAVSRHCVQEFKVKSRPLKYFALFDRLKVAGVGKWRDIVPDSPPQPLGNDDGGPREGAPRWHSAGFWFQNCRKVVLSIDLEGQSMELCR